MYKSLAWCKIAGGVLVPEPLKHHLVQSPVAGRTSTNFPTVTYLDNQDCQDFLLDAVDDAIIAYSHSIQSVVVLEFFTPGGKGSSASSRMQASIRCSNGLGTAVNAG